MGMFKDIRKLQRQAKEIDKTWDPAAQMREGMQRMQAAQSAIAQQTAAVQLGANGERADAQVLAARDTGTQLNHQPMLDVDLLVTRAGQPPYPVTVRQTVSVTNVGRLVPGASIAVMVDPADPTTVMLGL
jgi:hypothetical protein